MAFLKGVYMFLPYTFISEKKNGDLADVVFRMENSYAVSYETLCSCRITEQEFMDMYNRANNKIMEQLELNKVDSK